MENTKKHLVIILCFILLVSTINISFAKETVKIKSKIAEENNNQEFVNYFDKNDLNSKKTVILNKDLELKNIYVSKHSYIKTPNNTQAITLNPTMVKNGESFNSNVYTNTYYTNVKKKKEQTFIDIYVPEESYDGENRIENYEIEIVVVAEEIENPLTINPASDIDYLIITNDTFYNSINNSFKDWKINSDDKINSIEILNLSTIITMSDCYVNGTYGDATNSSGGNPWITNGKEINSNYNLFNDTQCKIRNCIRKYASEYNTSYILLVGNKDYMPPRMICTYGHSGPDGTWYNDTSHASDMYFSNLHYCMNNNTNSRWMENNFGSGIYWATVPEWDEIDWGFDIAVGRIPVNSIGELSYWINKTKAYVNGNSIGNYLKNGMMPNKDSSNQLTSFIWDECGDEFPDNITFLNNNTLTQAQWDEIDDYCNGYEDANFSGFALIHHAGHGGTLYSIYKPSNLNNSDIPNFLYTEGCSSGDFGTDTSSRAEAWMSDDGGMFAGIVNSAFGWFVASTWYAEEMWAQMFNESRGINELCFARAHNDAREEVGYTLHSVAPMIYKETNFFGDPAQEYLWYDEPETATIYFSPENISVFVGDKFDINITINPNENIVDTVSVELINFTAGIINCTNIEWGDFFDDNVINIEGTINNTAGNITTIAWATISHPTNQTGTFVTLTFEAINNGTAYIEIDDSEEILGYASIPLDFVVLGNATINSTYFEWNICPYNNSKYVDVYNPYVNITMIDNGCTVDFFWGNGTLIDNVTNLNESDIASILLIDYMETDWLEHDTIYSWYANVTNQTETTTTPVYTFHTSKPYDIVVDGDIDIQDVSCLVNNYGLEPTPGSVPADIIEDGDVNIADVSSLVNHYGEEY